MEYNLYMHMSHLHMYSTSDDITVTVIIGSVKVIDTKAGKGLMNDYPLCTLRFMKPLKPYQNVKHMYMGTAFHFINQKPHDEKCLNMYIMQLCYATSFGIIINSQDLNVHVYMYLHCVYYVLLGQGHDLS